MQHRAATWDKMVEDNISATQWAYLAGLIDGEGNVGVYRHENKKYWSSLYSAKIIITSTSEEVIAWLLNNIGGSFWARSRKNSKWKHCYCWYPNMSDMLTVCHGVLPYAVIKREQIKLLMQYPFGLGRGQSSTKSITDLKQKLYKRTLKLNKVGANG